MPTALSFTLSTSSKILCLLHYLHTVTFVYPLVEIPVLAVKPPGPVGSSGEGEVQELQLVLHAGVEGQVHRAGQVEPPDDGAKAEEYMSEAGQIGIH